MNELRYALKLITKNIRFSLLCISVLALGVGMILPFYALVLNVTDKELPVDQGDRYIVLEKILANSNRAQSEFRYDAFHYDYFKDNATSFKLLQAWRELTVSIDDDGYSESYRGAEVEPGLLNVLGIQPLLGRLFSEEDALFGSDPVAILSFNNWQIYFAASEDIIGYQSNINGEVRTIIGVMPEAFTFPVYHELWLPLSLSSDVNPGDGLEDLVIVGILADDADISAASSEVQLLQSQIKSIWPDNYEHIESSQVVRYSRIIGGQVNGVSMLFWVIILLITLNVGNLFFVRGEERLRELAIRSALGADRKRIAQALMLESFLISFIGLLFGLFLASFIITYLSGVFSNPSVGLADTFWWDMSLNGNIIFASVLATSAVWIMSGGLPAWRISRANISDFVNGGGNGLTEGGATRINKILVNSQLVLGCVLLTFGVFTVFTNSSASITTINSSENLFTGYVDYNEEAANEEKTVQAYRSDLEQSLFDQSGVTGVTFTTTLPGTRGPSLPYRTEEQDLLDRDAYPTQYVLSVSNTYFELFGIQVLQGRGFGFEDEYDSFPVAIIDQNLADSLWPNESVIGKRIQVNPGENAVWLSIIGVVETRTQEPSLLKGQAGSPVLYRPIQQEDPLQFWIIFSSDDPGIDYRRTLGSAASTAYRGMPISRISSLLQIEESRFMGEALNTNIGIAFLLVALYLTAMTTYGLAARITSRRRTEMGVRMAIGARKIDCLRVILKDGFLTLLFGLGIGGTLAVLGTYSVLTLTSMPVATFDTLIFVTSIVCLLMGVVVMLANYFPAKKIVDLEPGEALHYE